MKRVLAMLPAFLCVGCLGAGQSSAPNLDKLALASAVTPQPSHTRSVAKSGPIAELPAETAQVAGVSQNWRDGRYFERVRLTTDGHAPESRIDLSVQAKGSGAGALARPTDDAIRAELSAEFPNMQMQFAPPHRYQNAYGDFGLAIGRTGQDLRCIYAWQYVDDARMSFGNGDRIAVDNQKAAPASLRVKLCRSDMTVDDLVTAVSRIDITLPDNFGSAKKAVASDAEPSSPATRKSSPGGETYASDEEPAPVVKHKRPRLKPTLASDDGPARKNKNKPKRAKDDEEEAPRYAPPAQIATSGASTTVSAQPEGQRFVASPPAATYVAARGAQPVSAARPAYADLPPQAFAGPSDSAAH